MFGHWIPLLQKTIFNLSREIIALFLFLWHEKITHCTVFKPLLFLFL